MTNAAEREAVALSEKRALLEPSLIKSSIVSERTFAIEVVRMRDGLNNTPPKHPISGEDISPADAVLFKQALLDLYNELRPRYREADNIFHDLDALTINTAEELGNKIAEDHPGDSKASIAARRYEQKLLREEQDRERAAGRWALGLWKDYYKDYKKDPDSYDLAGAVSRLQTAGWTGVTEAELNELFSLSLEIENDLSKSEQDAATATDEQIQDLSDKLDKLKGIAGASSVAETQVLHNRLWMRYQSLLSEWTTGIDLNFAKEVENKLSPNELSNYQDYLAALISLKQTIEMIKEDPSQLDSTYQEFIIARLEIIQRDENQVFLINPVIKRADGFNRLEILHHQVVEEAETLLGIQNDELESIFTGDVNWWMFAHHGAEWRATQKLWAKYSPNRAEALSAADRREAEELLDYFSDKVGHLNDTDGAGGGDVAEYYRQLALDIQINRLQEVIDQAPEVDRDGSERTTPALGRKIPPESGLPRELEQPEDTVGGWALYYTEASEIYGYDFLKNQVKELTTMWENQSDISVSFGNQFHEEKRYQGLRKALADYRGEAEEEMHELGTFFEMSKILFEAQVETAHSLSMTCDMDKLPDWESKGVLNELFDYFSLEEDETEDGESRYKYSHYIQRSVQEMIKIVYEQPEVGFIERDKGGKVFKSDGTPQKGWFNYYYWKDTLENKKDLLARMEYELKTNIAPDLDAEDIKQIAFLSHRMATITGFRLDMFGPYQACGATPVDMLGELSKYIGEVNLFAPELYSPYKKRIYLQLAEIIEIPDAWWEGEMKGHKKTSWEPRMRDVKRAYDASRLLASSLNTLREPLVIPIKEDGIRIRNTYYSMFDLYFDKDIRAKRRGADVTLKSWKRGKSEFVSFKQMCFDIPGGVDVKNIGQYSEEELREKLIDYVDKVINKGLSYMKKNAALANWREMGILARWAIDRCFRVYALKDQSTTGPIKFLNEIRARLDQANTVFGVGKSRSPEEIKAIFPGQNLNITIDSSTGDIGGLSPDKNTRKSQMDKMEKAGILLSPLEKEKDKARTVDVRVFLLESFPNWQILDLKNMSLSKPQTSRKKMSRVIPSVGNLAWTEHAGEKSKYEIMVNRILSRNEFEFFKRSAVEGIFGRKPAEQQKAPDEK